jgi:hypothetical protein
MPVPMVSPMPNIEAGRVRSCGPAHCCCCPLRFLRSSPGPACGGTAPVSTAPRLPPQAIGRPKGGGASAFLLESGTPRPGCEGQESALPGWSGSGSSRSSRPSTPPVENSATTHDLADDGALLGTGTFILQPRSHVIVGGLHQLTGASGGPIPARSAARVVPQEPFNEQCRPDGVRQPVVGRRSNGEAAEASQTNRHGSPLFDRASKQHVDSHRFAASGL